MMARKPKTSVSAPVTPEAPRIVAYKGFNRDWTCRGFQYEVGKTYTTDAAVVRCASGGFHSCENPFDVWTYYPLAGNVFAEVEVGGQIDREVGGDSKITSAEITIKAELHLPDFIKRAVAWVLDNAKGNTATGYRGHAAATGDSGHAAATGYRGHAAATGYSGHAAATGYSGHAAATGDSGHATATGDRGHAAATGDSGHATATGYSGHATATGYRGHAAATGDSGIAASLNGNSTATAAQNGGIVLAYWAWREIDGKKVYALVHLRAAMVGGPEGIKAGVTYRLNEAGEFEVPA